MFSLLFLAQSDLEKEAREVMKDAVKRAGEFGSISAEFEVENWSVLPENHCVYRLRWRQGRFDLVLLERKAGPLAGSWYGDGRQVLLVMPDGRRLPQNTRPPKGHVPAWESLAGPLFSWTARTASSQTLFLEPKPIKPIRGVETPEPLPKLEFGIGPEKEFQGSRVIEILGHRAQNSVGRWILDSRTRQIRAVYAGEGRLVVRKLEVGIELPRDLGRAPQSQ